MIETVKARLRDWSYRFKHFLFRNFWIFAPVVIATGLVWLIGPDWFLDWKFGLEWRQRLAIVGGILSGLYLLQRQKLEETRLFEELFRSFNDRYDQMNGDLNQLMDRTDEQVITKEDKNLLYDYFNLCAEEYLFYKRGYIPPTVWESWEEGMRYYMRDPRIRRIWEEDESTQGNSYYDLEMPMPEE
jgi:hypothetical protein